MSFRLQDQYPKAIQIERGVRQANVILPKLFTAMQGNVFKLLEWNGLPYKLHYLLIVCNFTSLQTYILVEKLANFYVLYTHILISFGLILFNFAPIYESYHSGAFSAINSNQTDDIVLKHCVYFVLPFDCERNIYGYIIVVIYNMYLSYNCSSCFCAFDILLVIIVFHIWGHLRILKNNLENFPMPLIVQQNNYILNGKSMIIKTSFYSPEETINIRKLIVFNIENHKYILE